jgi:hypothetical protein
MGLWPIGLVIVSTGTATIVFVGAGCDREASGLLTDCRRGEPPWVR